MLLSSLAQRYPIKLLRWTVRSTGLYKKCLAVQLLKILITSETLLTSHVLKALCISVNLDLRQIHRRVGTEVVLSFIASRLDYCNSVLAGLLRVTLEPLQRVQNTAVRLILDLNLWNPVTLGLRQLHWLPVHWRIQYKLCFIMQSIHVGRCPCSLLGGVHSNCR